MKNNQLLEAKNAQTREVMVPLWDYYLEKEENVPGVQEIFPEPKILTNRRDFGFAYVIHQPKHHSLDILPQGCDKLSESDILKIANSFNIDKVKVRVWRGGSYPNGKISRYELSYGEKCYNWNNETLKIQKTILSDLNYKEVLVYGVTKYENGEIIHTNPILQ